MVPARRGGGQREPDQTVQLYQPPHDQGGADQPPELPVVSSGRERAILARWPHLAVPGAGRCNRVAPTLQKALARARRGKRPAAKTVARLTAAVRRRPRAWAPILAHLLAQALDEGTSR